MGMKLEFVRKDWECSEGGQVKLVMHHKFSGLDISAAIVEPDSQEDMDLAIDDAFRETEVEMRSKVERLRPEMEDVVGYSLEMSAGKITDPKNVSGELELIIFYDLPVVQLENELGKVVELLKK